MESDPANAHACPTSAPAQPLAGKPNPLTAGHRQPILPMRRPRPTRSMSEPGPGRDATEGRAMGLFDKAKEAAEHAAERARNAAEQAAGRASGAAERGTSQARGGSGSAGDQLRAAAGQARVAAGSLGKATGNAVGTAATAVADPANQAHARDAAQRGLKRAKSGVASIIDRIDPGLLADIVIKATSLQEKANRRLRRSTPRIGSTRSRSRPGSRPTLPSRSAASKWRRRTRPRPAHRMPRPTSHRMRPP